MVESPKDFRSDRMESPEGKGIARRAWDAYAAKVNKAAKPAVDRLAPQIAAPIAADLVGFWVLWHLEGGFEGLRRIGMSRASIYRRINLFRRSYGEHPDVFVIPGIKLDVEKYLAGWPPKSQG